MKRFLLLSTMFMLLLTSRGYGQFIEDFEAGIPADWATFKTVNGAVVVGGPAPNWGTTTTGTLVCEGTQSAYIDRTNIGAGNVAEGWLVTPQITVPPNGRLYFTAKQTFAIDYGTEYIVRISQASQTNIEDFEDFYVLDENGLSPLGWDQCFEHGVTPTINLDEYVGENIYIAFVKKDTQPAGAPNADRMELDMVKVLEACLPPSNLGVVTQSTTAQLTWAGITSGTWEIEFLEGNVTGTGTPTHSGNTVPFEMDGLTAATTYTYYVRANCGDSVSEWAGPFTFTTGNCGDISQCNYSFILTDTFGDGWNGNTMTVSQNGIEIEVLTLGAGTTTTIKVALCEGMPFDLFWNTGGNFVGEVGITVVDAFGEIIFIKPPGPGAKGTLLFSDVVNCTPPTC